MRSWAAAGLLLLCADPALTDLDRRALEAMPGIATAGDVTVHFDPATVGESEAAAEAKRAEAALLSLETRLDTRLDGPAHLFLYRDAAEFEERTGAPGCWEALASGPRSIHLPRGAHVRHEIAHLLAARFPGAAGRDPGGLLREGLATAMEGEDRGVPVVSWAAVYARVGVLPPLADLRDRWPEGPPARFHPYHAAGAFVQWLLDTRGLAKVKALYAEPARAEDLLGRSWAEAESDWRAWLERRAVEPAQETEIRRWLGLPVERVRPALAATAPEALPSCEGLAGWIPRGAAGWSAAGGALRGLGGEAWSALETGREWPAGAALRLRARAGDGATLLLRMDRTSDSSDEALLGPDGSLLTIRGGMEGFACSPARLVRDRWTEVLVLEDGGDARLYLDGWLVLESRGAFRGGGGAVGLGVRGGAVEVRDAAVLLPRR